MADKNLTIFQRLSKMMGRGVQQKNTEPEHSYNLNTGELLRTHDKQEFELNKLQHQQSKFLMDRWAKIDNELYNKSMVHESTRLAAYMDYEGMEVTPEISAALDIYAEESTTPSEKGEILSVYSESKRVRSTLTNLFNNVLDVPINLPMWTRNTCKYGDDFVYLKIDPEKGIVGCYQLPNVEIERLEGDSYKNPSTNRVGYEINNKEDLQSRQVKFRWKDKNIEFQPWEIAHFRLLGDDRKLPYGTSMLDKCRRIWKQLLLAEDAMLIYRTSRAPERRVFKVFVGNMEDGDVEAYVQRVANKFKREQVVNPANGQVDTRYNQMPVWKGTPIPLLDGRTITIEELSNEYEQGKENWVYSVQDKTHQVVPGKVIWCGKNYTAEKMIKVWLDDETWVMTAPEHPFILRDGTQRRADELQEGDSLMPFYHKIGIRKNTKYLKDYEAIFNPNSGKYEYTHRLVGLTIPKENSTYNTVHHIDFDKRNNNPNNLQWVDFFEHKKMHSALAKKNWSNPEWKKKTVEKSSKTRKQKWDNGEYEDIRKEASENTKIRWDNGTYDGIGDKVSKTFKKKYDSGELEELKKENGQRITNYNQSDKKKERNKELAKEQNWGDRFVEYNHSDLHKEHDKIRCAAQKKDWSNPEKRKQRSDGMRIKFDDFVWSTIKANITAKKVINRKTLIEFLSTELIDYIISINKNDRLNNLRKVERGVIERQVNEQGFSTTTDFIKAHQTNHKVLRIESIHQTDDVFCMTVVGANGEDDRHNFAIRSFDKDNNICDNGCFVANSVDQDYFLPVRDPGQPSPIETLPGASNLGEIADIEYIQKKMLAALRIPKAFLGFEEVVGEGKGLSMMDIRFARTINRIQKSMIQELNKIAIVHLYLLGFEDELDNFTLGLTNPSTQSDLLKIEQWKEKVLLYKDAVGDGQSIAPTSHTFAKKYFLGMSDDEVKLDLQQQMVERGIAEELNQAKNIQTGIFTKIQSMYQTAAPAGGAEGEEGGSAPSGGGGGGSLSSGSFGGGGAEDLGASPEGGDATQGAVTPGAEGGAEGSTTPTPADTGGATPPPAGGTETASEPEEPEDENTKTSLPPLSESRLNQLLDMRGEKHGEVIDFNKGREKLNEINERLKKLLDE